MVKSITQIIPQIEVPEWYAIAFGSLVALWLGYRIAMKILGVLSVLVSLLFWKFLVYPRLHLRYHRPGQTNPLRLFVIVLYLTINGLCMGLPVGTTSQVASRSGILSTINLVSLFTGSRLSLAADALGWSLRAQMVAHKWVGLLVTGQALLHSASSLAMPHWDELHVTGIVACSSLLLACILTLPFLRRWSYEIFLRVHLLLAFSAAVALWRHVSVARAHSRLFVIVGLAVWASLTGADLCLYCFRNFSFGKDVGRTTITQLDDILKLDVTVPRPWKVRPGQYVYLWLPTVSLWTSGHPFSVAWWNTDDRGLTLSFLVEPRTGLTRRLRHRAETTHLTIIGGPYGYAQDLGEYGTVLMFVTGVGIAAQLPHVKALIHGANNFETRTRRIRLIWQIQKERHQAWISDWMNEEVLPRDSVAKQYVLEAQIHVLGSYKDPSTNYGNKESFGLFHKLDRIHEEPRIEEILATEHANMKGRMAISTSTDSQTNDRIRRWVQQRLDKNLRLIEGEFQPAPDGNLRGSGFKASLKRGSTRREV